MTEINKNFYCSASACSPKRHCSIGCGLGEENLCSIDAECGCYLHKWPTPEQFEAEYGYKWPDDGAVYLMIDGAWTVAMYHFAQNAYKGNPVVVACTPWGKPPADWRPE